jgi:peptide/nickel transport system ATP-binding protein
MDLLPELQDLVNTSYLFLPHDLPNSRYIPEKSNGRIGVMYLGKLVEIGPYDEILANPCHPYTKALIWATPSLGVEDVDSMPIRKIDIPSPTNPPSGCRFHTRCPEAREACVSEAPELDESGAGGRIS